MARYNGNRRSVPTPTKELIVYMLAFLHPKKVARYLGLSTRTVFRVYALWASTGSVIRERLQDGRPRKLNGLDAAVSIGLKQARTPDIYLDELQDMLAEGRQVFVSIATIERTLYRRGWTRKTIARPAIERDEAQRDQYRLQVGLDFDGGHDKLVFLDESGVDRRSTRRRYGWAPSGNRSRKHDFFVRGQRYSILPALSVDGILHLHIQNHSYTTDDFNRFVESLLDQMNPYPGRNSVLVMDNHSIHKSEELRELVEARGCRLLFLPSYSPDLNPIEEMFSHVKSWLRRHRLYARRELLTRHSTCDPYRMLWDAVFTTTSSMAKGWFYNSGYSVY